MDEFTNAEFFLKNEETYRPWIDENHSKESVSSFDEISLKMLSKMVWYISESYL